MFDQVGWCGNTLPVEFGEGRFAIESVPLDDGIDQQVQPLSRAVLTSGWVEHRVPISARSERYVVRRKTPTISRRISLSYRLFWHHR
jgi:hypothetical protein